MQKHINTVHFTCKSMYLLLILPLAFSGLNCQIETANKQPQLVFDFDIDNIADADDLDDDNDGIPDDIESTDDLDGDKIPNHQDRDSDGDGINDLIEALGVDKDGDGMLDPWDEWSDVNQNGFHDEYEAEPLVVLTFESSKKMWKSNKDFNGISLDIDGDQIPNFWDLDNDNDDKTDSNEWGRVPLEPKMVNTNADGFDDRLVGHIYTQGDKESRSGHPEISVEALGLYQSIYADGTFGVLNGKPDIDDNDNGIPNFFDKYKN